MTRSRTGDVFALIDVLDKSAVVLSLYVRLKHNKHLKVVYRQWFTSVVEARRHCIAHEDGLEPTVIKNRFE